MSVGTAALVAVVAGIVGLVGLAAGGLGVWYLLRRRTAPLEPESAAATGMTVSQVLDLIVLVSRSGIAVVDEHRDVVLHNPRSEELGVVRNMLLDDRAWSAARRVFESGEITEYDLSSTGRNPIAVRGTARLLTEDDERLVVVFADDDTEQARMEATRRDFVANVSHELKTPVGALSLLAEALLESAEDPASVRHFGEQMVAESTRLGNMVNELIALSRLQGAEKLPEMDIVDVDEFVEAAIDRSRTRAEAAGITVRTDRPSGLEVRGDGTLLVTALSNLVENAINYSPAGSTVSVCRGLRNGMVAIAVTDRGIGIAKQDQERVFERFFRADKARSRATGGTGLGLAIVKHVAANHRGDIKLWSNVGTGSTFTLEIPAYVDEPEPSTSAAAEAGRRTTERSVEAAR